MDKRCASVFFSPRPYIREPASHSIWGASPLILTRAEPLADLAFPSDPAEDASRQSVMAYAMKLTTRISRIHSTVQDLGYRLSPTSSDGIQHSVLPIVRPRGTVSMAQLLHWATQAGVASPRIRGDQAWIGGGNPLDAALVLPDASTLDPQLADFFRFFFRHIDVPSKAAAEAIAYQLLTIHPLADGNGRLTRSLLIRLTASTKSAYPLYLAWRLMFGGEELLDSWAEISGSSPIPSDDTHYTIWLTRLMDLTGYCSDAESAGVDARLINALLFYGSTDETAIIRSNPACTPSLARKLIERSMALSGSPLPRLQEEIQQLIQSLKELIAA